MEESNSKSLINIHQPTRRHIPQDSSLHKNTAAVSCLQFYAHETTLCISAHSLSIRLYLTSRRKPCRLNQLQYSWRASELPG